MTEISRQSGITSQNRQSFISDSPWAGERVIKAVQAEITRSPAFAEAVSVGAGRQHNRRWGKVALSQSEVFVALVTPQANRWVDGELFVPAGWFEPAQRNGLPFGVVAMDDLDGRNRQFCRRLDEADLEYDGDIPANTTVYLDPSRFETQWTKRGKPTKKKRLVAQHRLQVRDLLDYPDVTWTRLTVRPTKRGCLTADWGRCRVWMVDGERIDQRWLLIGRDPNQVTDCLSNAPLKTSMETMAWRKSHRAFIERSNHNSKDDFGWDEFQATQYRAWQHQLALMILAGWFVAETRLGWQARFATDPDLLTHYEADELPLLSVGNVRSLLRAAMPLPDLPPEKATALVIDHLVNRTRPARKLNIAKVVRYHQGC